MHIGEIRAGDRYHGIPGFVWGLKDNGDIEFAVDNFDRDEPEIRFKDLPKRVHKEEYVRLFDIDRPNDAGRIIKPKWTGPQLVPVDQFHQVKAKQIDDAERVLIKDLLKTQSIRKVAELTGINRGRIFQIKQEMIQKEMISKK